MAKLQTGVLRIGGEEHVYVWRPLTTRLLSEAVSRVSSARMAAGVEVELSMTRELIRLLLVSRDGVKFDRRELLNNELDSFIPFIEIMHLASLFGSLSVPNQEEQDGFLASVQDVPDDAE